MNAGNLVLPFGNLVRAPFCRRARQMFGRLLDLALPNQCALCGNLSQRTLCRGCDETYWNEPRARCLRCALPLPALRLACAAPRNARSAGRRELDRQCASCIADPPHFDATLALADYRAPLDTLALDLKFRASLATAHAFARLLHAAFENSDLPLPDVVAPVPLSKKRLTGRGYNQAWAVARPLARRLGVEADAMLAVRTTNTLPQSKLDLDTRRRNVANAFAVTRDVRGRHVAIVDDVMTSGATLDALARTLKAAGARRVTNFVALRTPKD